MVITDRFLYLHQPKTGGTFVTSVLFRLHGIRWGIVLRILSTMRPELAFRGKHGTLFYLNNKHGERRSVPVRHRRSRILATLRNPYDLLVSQYEYGWWKKRAYLPYFLAIPEFRSRYPHFPRLTFPEFVEASEEAFQTMPNRMDRADSMRPGLLTREFLRFYCLSPEPLLDCLDRGEPCLDEVRSELREIHFLRQSRLNADLHDFLESHDYTRDELAFLPSLGKILPGKGRTADQRWPGYFTPELLQRVRRRERLLFELFPEFDDPGLAVA
jgi:hypothetical protein